MCLQRLHILHDGSRRLVTLPVSSVLAACLANSCKLHASTTACNTRCYHVLICRADVSLRAASATARCVMEISMHESVIRASPACFQQHHHAASLIQVPGNTCMLLKVDEAITMLF
eukprot:5864930-Amphidinium_carterae.2